MKKSILILLAGFFVNNGWSQTACDQGRYSSNVFANITISNDIQFGQNTNAFGSNVNLMLDFYEPTGDTASLRPLIIWAHGGSFIGGDKTDSDVVTLSQDFAEKGFVCASINYRTGMWPIDSTNAVKAVVRAVQDMKAAVRFFYKDRQTANTYKIDTTMIFVGGSSAGAITATHLAYLDRNCEAEEYLTPTELSALGGIEGDSGNPGYSTDVSGVINLCGALARYGYIEVGDIPFCSLHGNNDDIVPYNRGVATVSGFDIMYLDGSRMMDEQANQIGVQSNFYTFYAQGHVPYLSSPAYMDTTINFVRDFVIDVMGCSDPMLQAENAPLETSTLYPLTYCDLSNENLQSTNGKIYPNPVNESVSINLNESGIHVVTIIDAKGKIIHEGKYVNSSISIDLSELENGFYFIQVINESTGSELMQKIIVDHQ